MSCAICDYIQASLARETADSIADAVSALNCRQPAEKPGGMVDLSQCPKCGLWYVYTVAISHDDYWYGVTGKETLHRLTREQSGVVDAMNGCQVDPATIESSFFELPGSAFDVTLYAAYAKNRDFVALFIPRLVHAHAVELLAVETRYSMRHVLRVLVDDKPSYAREVLAGVTSLPPELREQLRDLEERCRDASWICQQSAPQRRR